MTSFSKPLLLAAFAAFSAQIADAQTSGKEPATGFIMPEDPTSPAETASEGIYTNIAPSSSFPDSAAVTVQHFSKEVAQGDLNKPSKNFSLSKVLKYDHMIKVVYASTINSEENDAVYSTVYYDSNNNGKVDASDRLQERELVVSDYSSLKTREAHFALQRRPDRANLYWEQNSTTYFEGGKNIDTPHLTVSTKAENTINAFNEMFNTAQLGKTGLKNIIGVQFP